MQAERQPTRSRREPYVRPTTHASARAPHPDLAVLARPDRHRWRGRAVHPEPRELRPVRGRPARSRTDPVPAVDPGRRDLDPRPADRRLDQRLHRQPLGPAQAVHRHRLAARPRLPRRASRLSNTILMLGAFAALLAVSTNIARGPFQGYVPGSRPGEAGRPCERDGRSDADPRATSPGSSWSPWPCCWARSKWRSSRSRSSSWSRWRPSSLRVGDGQPPKPRNGKSWGDDRPRGVGHRRPQGALLRLAAGLALLLPHGRAPSSST